MNPMTSSRATGSFSPDSPSSARASRRRRRDPRRTAKIAAVSVAAIARADDQSLEQVEVEEPGRGDPGDHGGADRADGRERDGGAEHGADLVPAGGQTTLEQDQDEADRPQGPGQLGVVEVDAADALGADQHPEAEEEQQARDAYAVGDLRRGEAGGEQEAGDEDQLVVGRHQALARLVGEGEPRVEISSARPGRGPVSTPSGCAVDARRARRRGAAAASAKPSSIRRSTSSISGHGAPGEEGRGAGDPGGRRAARPALGERCLVERRRGEVEAHRHA